MIDLFMSKRDWNAIFMASIFLIVLLLVSLAGRVAIWILISLFVVVAIVSFYFANMKKRTIDEEEASAMLNEIKESWMGKKK